MSSVNITQPGKITLILKGLVLIFINSSQTECSIGMIREAPPGHKLRVKILRSVSSQPDVDPIDFATLDEALADQLTLTITNTMQTGIRKRGSADNINRLTGGGPATSFKWIVDFETELYRQEIGARRDGFRTFFKFNNGEIFTQRKSINDLYVRRARQCEWTRFGKVAVEVGVDIPLDQANSSATLTNGGNVIFQSGPETSYLIYIDRGDETPHTSAAFDADYYFTAIGTRLDLGRERVFFKSDPIAVSPSEPGTPDAACFDGYLSLSQPT